MFPLVDDLRSIEFGTPGKSRENLVNFIINGNKRATAGLAAMALCASQTSLTNLSLAVPCSTYTFQGCVLVPLGERAATCNKSSNTALSTGLFK